MPPAGLEPATNGLKVHCAAIALRRRKELGAVGIMGRHNRPTAPNSSDGEVYQISAKCQASTPRIRSTAASVSASPAGVTVTGASGT